LGLSGYDKKGSSNAQQHANAGSTKQLQAPSAAALPVVLEIGFLLP